MDKKEILNEIEQVIDPSYLKLSILELQNNSADYDSIVIKSPTTLYRNVLSGNKSVLFCRLKTEKKMKYFSFSSKYEKDFHLCGLETSSIQSEPDFVRIGIDEFMNALPNIQKLLNKIFVESFSFPSFGCCSKFKECSQEGLCIHEDLLYATACMYRKNLESGKIFY